MQPARREVRKSAGKGAGGYAAFVKENYGRVAVECKGLSMAGIMVEVGRRYREMKATEGAKGSRVGVETEEKKKIGVEVVEVESDEDEIFKGQAVELDSVARKLDFLTL